MIFEEQPETETLGYQFHVHQPSSTRTSSQLNSATSSFVFPFQLPPSYLLALVFRPLSSDRYFLKVHFLGFTSFLTFGRFYGGGGFVARRYLFSLSGSCSVLWSPVSWQDSRDLIEKKVIDEK